jgi:hypothetical protein
MIHIQKFIERLQGLESRGAKDYIVPIKDAKNLHADITKLLLTLESLRTTNENNSANQTVSVEVSGGNF